MHEFPGLEDRVTIVPWPARGCVVAVRENKGIVREVWIEKSEERIRWMVAMGLAGSEAMLSSSSVLAERLMAYFAGKPDNFRDMAIESIGCTEVARSILDACRAIPYGEVRTYSDLASAVGRPRAARAVGRVMSQNSCPILIGCHRVLRRDGTIGGYSGYGGKNTKRWLLELEARSQVRSFSALGGAVASLGPLT